MNDNLNPNDMQGYPYQAPQQPQQPYQQPYYVAQPPQPQPLPPHKSLLGWAITITVLCCQAFGIPAIVFASLSNGSYAKAYKAMDPVDRDRYYQQSLNQNKKSKTWIIVGAISGFVILLACVIIGIATGFLVEMLDNR